MTIFVKDEHPPKPQSPIIFTPSETVTAFSDVQSWNAAWSTTVTLDGTVMVESAVQF